MPASGPRPVRVAPDRRSPLDLPARSFQRPGGESDRRRSSMSAAVLSGKELSEAIRAETASEAAELAAAGIPRGSPW
nr:hypothetical protein GCM10020093_065990 [Planobispora longispora]